MLGVGEDDVEKILDKAKSQKDKSEELEDDRPEDDELEPNRPTWIRIATKFVLPETLDHYKLIWEYEDVS